MPHPDRSTIDPRCAAAHVGASFGCDFYRRIAAAMAILIAEFNAYLDRPQADPVADSVGHRQHALWLSPGELAELISELRSAILPRMRNEPSPDRTQHLLSPIMFPIEQSPDTPRS